MICHEVAFYFLMKPRGTKELHSNSYSNGAREAMYWIPIENIDKYNAYPRFMKNYLEEKPVEIKHIITDDRL